MAVEDDLFKEPESDKTESNDIGSDNPYVTSGYSRIVGEVTAISGTIGTFDYSIDSPPITITRADDTPSAANTTVTINGIQADDVDAFTLVESNDETRGSLTFITRKNHPLGHHMNINIAVDGLSIYYGYVTVVSKETRASSNPGYWSETYNWVE